MQDSDSNRQFLIISLFKKNNLTRLYISNKLFLWSNLRL